MDPAGVSAWTNEVAQMLGECLSFLLVHEQEPRDETFFFPFSN